MLTLIAFAFKSKFYYTIRFGQVFVTWIPKCACTSLLEAFISCSDEFRGSLAKAKDSIEKCNIIHSVAYSEKLALSQGDLNENIDGITILRDPYDRIVSTYLDKFVRKESAMSQVFSFVGHNNIDHISFFDFVVAVIENGLIFSDHHLEPQHSFLLQRSLYTKLFKLESYSKAASFLLERGVHLRDLRKELPHTRSGNKVFENNAFMLDAKSLRETFYANNRCSLSTSSFYNDEIFKLVNSAYRKDYEIYAEAL